MVLEDSGHETLEDPPKNEKEEFILYLQAMCATERCLTTELMHQDADFQGVFYNPAILQVRIIDIEFSEDPNPEDKPQDVWVIVKLNFGTYFRHQKNWHFH